MSVNILKIIPSTPDYIPGDEQQESARSLLSQVFNSGRIDMSTTDTVQFIDPGANFERVSCNVCEQEIPSEEWQELMDAAHKNDFSDLDCLTSCQHWTSLNELNYNWPAGLQGSSSAFWTLRLTSPTMRWPYCKKYSERNFGSSRHTIDSAEVHESQNREWLQLS